MLPGAVDLIAARAGLGLIVLPPAQRLRSPRRWVRFADFPRLQAGRALAVVTGLLLRRMDYSNLWQQLFAVALILRLACQALRIFPCTPIAPHPVRKAKADEQARTIRILIANVMMENRHADPLLGLIRRWQPDLG
jgi:endonuclease/exonuclease/phosphatase (EEP) superfamily protein YafD